MLIRPAVGLGDPACSRAWQRRGGHFSRGARAPPRGRSPAERVPGHERCTRGAARAELQGCGLRRADVRTARPEFESTQCHLYAAGEFRQGDHRRRSLRPGFDQRWSSRQLERCLATAGALAGVARYLKLPINAVNFERVGSTDSESFARLKIPRITLHSLTQKSHNEDILHTSKDKLSAMNLDDYYDTYHLVAVYLVFLDRPFLPDGAIISPGQGQVP